MNVSDFDGDSAVQDDVAQKEESDKALICVACSHVVTHERFKVSRGGAHQHSFTNPTGYVYQIGCFESAPGAMPLGEYTGEFTWFKDYAWCYADCGRCHNHLGWHFSGTRGSDFFGLRLDQIAEM